MKCDVCNEDGISKDNMVDINFIYQNKDFKSACKMCIHELNGRLEEIQKVNKKREVKHIQRYMYNKSKKKCIKTKKKKSLWQRFLDA
jgi:hypothetical protein